MERFKNLIFCVIRRGDLLRAFLNTNNDFGMAEEQFADLVNEFGGMEEDQLRNPNFGEQGPQGSFWQQAWNSADSMMDENDFIDYTGRRKRKSPRGANLSKLKINKLKKKLKGAKCSVCLNTIKPKQKVVRLKCGHHFHYKCIVPWLKENNSCPNCRQRVT